MSVFDSTFDNVLELLAPMWVEVSFMLFFTLGFTLLRFELFPLPGKGSKGGKGSKAGRGVVQEDMSEASLLFKQLETDAAAGHAGAALQTWQVAKTVGPAPCDTLKVIVQLLLESKSGELVLEVLEHFDAHAHALRNPKSATAVLDVVARAGRVDLLDELAREFERKLLIHRTSQTYEVLLGGHASAGDASRVSELLVEIGKSRQKLTARGYSLTIKGFLKNGMLDAALLQMKAMQQDGFFVPSYAVAQLFRSACQNARATEILDASEALGLPSEALVVLFEHCLTSNDLQLALRVEKVARERKAMIPAHAYDALLKTCVVHASAHAFHVLQRMQDEGLKISEGLCVGLLARCADSKFLSFAEEIARYVRGKAGMTIAIYSALMKCYAFCGMYDNACDLYAQIRAEGLEPDSMMYGCLMKFSVECGRTDLSQELFDKAPHLDIQNYMSLIRAAGRDKDVDRAFAVLEKLKASGVRADIAAYNCVLDVCVSVGDIKRARGLMAEMQTIANLDVVTYNTLLKGYCTQGDVRGAKELLNEMDRVGLAPNDVSYNCLINTAVSSGNFQEAWSTIESMERKGVAVDHFTISTMMKALKRLKDPRDVGRALELLDRSGIDVCSDEVLLNTVLETCTRHRQLQRLEKIITIFTNSKLRPSAHTYGPLIKACSTLKWLDKCKALWHTMVNECAMQPNDIVLGCMLDALVCNGHVEAAVDLLQQWKSTITPNTVMYSTIIKGFANNRQASRAMDIWKEMSELGLALNTVVYNALIDAQARVGAMDEVSKLIACMGPSGCTPDSITYSTIVKGYCVKGDADKAFEVFRDMQASGMAKDSVVYNTIIDGCTRQNRMDLVDSALEDMNRFNIAPSNFTLGILVKMYGRRRQLDNAFQIIEELPKKHGLRINIQVRTSLMSACLNNNDLDRALQVFEDLKRAEGGADSNAYGSLISGFVRRGHFESAIWLVEDAYGLGGDGSKRRGLLRGQSLEAEALEQLVRALGQRQLMKTLGVPLLEKLRAARIPLSGKLLSVTIPH